MAFRTSAQRAAQEEALKNVERKRWERLEAFNKDPYLGFQNLDSAMLEAKLTSQPEVLARLLNRENLFISGLAGAGKTTVINRFIELIDAEYSGAFNIAVTATTGIAATLIGGSTIHSWSGLGFATEPFDKDNINDFMKNKIRHIRKTDVLIIDEISMMPAYLFVKLDEWLKYANQTREPFGGIQVVFIGDFLQLSPVVASDSDLDDRFAIETLNWKEADVNYCFMDKSYRANDERLKKILLEIAGNRVSQETRELIRSRIGDAKRDKNKVYATLFTTNRNVDKYNLEKFNENPNERHVFYALTEGDSQYFDKIIKQNKLQEVLEFKVDDIIIVTKNIKDMEGNVVAANGSVGKIISFNDSNTRVEIKLNNGETKHIYYESYVHTIEREMKIHNKIIKFTEEVATVSQLPLKLGYAITVHKSQGQTFDGVVADLSQCFLPGLGYVALSRVRSLDDLVITRINERAYKISEKSQKITLFVKKKAYLERKKFIAEKEMYDELLTNSFVRSVMWNVDETAELIWAAKKARNNKIYGN